MSRRSWRSCASTASQAQSRTDTDRLGLSLQPNTQRLGRRSQLGPTRATCAVPPFQLTPQRPCWKSPRGPAGPVPSGSFLRWLRPLFREQPSLLPPAGPTSWAGLSGDPSHLQRLPSMPAQTGLLPPQVPTGWCPRRQPHVAVYTQVLRRRKWKLRFLGLPGCISRAQEPQVVSGDCLTARTSFPPCRKCCWTGPL